ncbi:hypothetical protein Prudu_002249 [Prunus dulcis]|uniref:Methyltransferase type 11 domain-containing protein n=1 Tax=Prunus dulcis TaxID=3755 RepID=A0A4Y1QQA4_PRUDU|nr:hypothetical protein Prudu_002249 [Prunus dulcis]
MGRQCVGFVLWKWDLAFLLSEKVGSSGKDNQSCYALHLRWVEGDAIDLPFSDGHFDAITMELMIDNVVVPVASGFGLAEDYKYLKSSIREFLTGKKLEELALDVGFSNARYYEIGGSLMGNLVATR